LPLLSEGTTNVTATYTLTSPSGSMATRLTF